MPFRANEAIDEGCERARRYLEPHDTDEATRAKSRLCIEGLIERLGPVVHGYPTWHPLVANHDSRRPETRPTERCGYVGLDHIILFRNGFVTCPYGDGRAVIDSVEKLPVSEVATISATRLEATLYHPHATPILVSCEWHKDMALDGTIPVSVALPMILEQEIPKWRWSQFGETWETMRPFFLGSPCGARSSLFINQEAGVTIRKIWKAVIETGAFGPIWVQD